MHHTTHLKHNEARWGHTNSKNPKKYDTHDKDEPLIRGCGVKRHGYVHVYVFYIALNTAACGLLASMLLAPLVKALHIKYECYSGKKKHVHHTTHPKHNEARWGHTN